MIKSFRLGMAVSAATAVMSAAPALSAPVSASTQATAKAQIVRPLTLTAKTNMDFGTILLSSVATGTTYTVTLTSGGALSCTAGLTCSTAGIPATFNVAGSKSQLVHIYTAASSFTNGTTTLQLTPSAQATLSLTNSGAPGTDFNVGAAFPIDSNTTEGVYLGNLNVTVDYN